MALDILRELAVLISLKGDEDARRGEKRLNEAVKDTTDSMKKQTKQTDMLGAGLSKMGVFVANLAANLGSMAIGFGLRTIGNTVDRFSTLLTESVFAASEAAEAQHRLRTALMLTGDTSQETMDQFEAFAKVMMQNSTVDDDATLGFLALAKSIGATNEQAMAIVEAAADFSAATGQDMESSVQSLSKSLQGSIGMMGRFLPQLGDFTEEQLKAGAALDFVGKRFKGAARAGLSTFAGAWIRIKNTVGNAMESIGEPLMNALIPALNRLNSIIVALTPDFRAFGKMMSEAFFAIVDGLGAFLGTQGGMRAVISRFGRFILDLALLFEDFLYFISGKDSAIGRKLGIAPGDMNMMKFIETMFKGGTQVLLPLATEIGIAIGKGIIDGIQSIFTSDEFMKSLGATDEEIAKSKDMEDAIKRWTAKVLVPFFGRSKFLEWLLDPDNMPATNIDATGVAPGTNVGPMTPGVGRESTSVEDKTKTWTDFIQGLGRTSMLPGPSTTTTDARTVNVQNDIQITTPQVAAAIQKQIDFAVFNAFTNVVA